MVEFEVRENAHGPVTEVTSRATRQMAGWEWVSYRDRRYQLFGGIRGPYFIDLSNPIRSRAKAPPVHHATMKKKPPAQLQREIDEVLRASDREKHGYDTDPLSDREFEQSARFEAKKYGLKHDEALRFVKHPLYLSIRHEVAQWSLEHGAAPNSSLARGYLLDRLRAR